MANTSLVSRGKPRPAGEQNASYYGVNHAFGSIACVTYRDRHRAEQEEAAVSTPEAGIDVGGTCVTASDVTEAIAWLEANMGTRFTFTQGMKGLSNPLAAWPAKRGYRG